MLHFSLRRLINPKKLLSKVQTEAAKIGLHIYAKKTEFMAYKKPDNIIINLTSGELLKKVQNIKYLGGWVASSEQDFEVREALALVCMQQDEKNMEVQHE